MGRGGSVRLAGSPATGYGRPTVEEAHEWARVEVARWTVAHDPRGMPLDPRQEAPLVGGGAREVGHRPAIRDLGAVQVARPRVAAEVDVDDRLAQRAEQRQLAQREEAVRRAEDERVVADECRGEEHHHRRPIQEPPRRAREAARRDGPPVQPRHDACQPTLIGRRCIATRVVPQVDERRPDADLLESGAQVAAVAGYLAKADEHRVRARAHSASSPRLPPCRRGISSSRLPGAAPAADACDAALRHRACRRRDPTARTPHPSRSRRAG